MYAIDSLIASEIFIGEVIVTVKGSEGKEVTMMLGGYEAQPDYYPQWHQPYNYVTQLPYGKFYSIDIHSFYLLIVFINMLVGMVYYLGIIKRILSKFYSIAVRFANKKTKEYF